MYKFCYYEGIWTIATLWPILKIQSFTMLLRNPPKMYFGTIPNTKLTCAIQRPSLNLFSQSIIGPIPKTNDCLRPSRRPSYVNLPSDGLTSPSVQEIADFIISRSTITISRFTVIILLSNESTSNLCHPEPIYSSKISLLWFFPNPRITKQFL